MSEPTRILFVCLGNIIRSPLAENMFAHLADQSGAADRYEVDSAGISGYHVGEQPDSRMRRVAAQNGLQYTGSARQFQVEDFDRFDLIISMDSSNLRSLNRMARTPKDLEKVITMRTFDPQGNPEAEVPDPYYGGIQGFQNTFDIVERSCRGLFNALENGELKI